MLPMAPVADTKIVQSLFSRCEFELLASFPRWSILHVKSRLSFFNRVVLPFERQRNCGRESIHAVMSVNQLFILSFTVHQPPMSLPFPW